MEKRKVVITGLGAICAIGDNVNEFTMGLKEGKNGISQIESISTENCLTNKGGEVKNAGELNIRENGRTQAFALKATQEAVEDSQLVMGEDKNVAVVIGTSLGSIEFMESTIYNAVAKNGVQTKEDALNWQKSLLGNVAAAISQKYGLNGPKLTISTACAAGTNSIGYAYDLIKNGYCDLAITGGADAISNISLTGFSSLMSLTTGFPKPFDVDRDGLALGEGAGILILESEAHALKRNAKIYGEITGYALCNDAYHATSPDPNGAGAYRGMIKCLEASNINASDINYINTHGTGTKANDIMEMKAICKLFGSNENPVYISSNKSLFGHCLGAAGSIEMISTVMSICHNFVPPTIHTKNQIQLDASEEFKGNSIQLVTGKMVPAKIHYALSNSFAFAGNIAIMGLKKYV